MNALTRLLCFCLLGCALVAAGCASTGEPDPTSNAERESTRTISTGSPDVPTH